VNSKSKSETEGAPDETAPQPPAGQPRSADPRIDIPGTRGRGVRPLSAGFTGNPEARIVPMGAFGQGQRGLAGYEDHGESEVFWMPPDTVQPGSAAAERQEQADSEASQDQGKPHS
jgi:hypothetical protein